MKRSQRKQGDIYAVPKKNLLAAGAAFYAVIALYAYTLSNNAVISLVFSAALIPFFLKSYGRSYRARKKRKTEKQFLEAMQQVLSGVRAGNSLEQAFAGVFEDAGKNGGTGFDAISEGIGRVIHKTQMNYSFYDELAAFAEQTDSEDIISCVKAMSIVGKRGGDLAYIIRNAAGNLRVKFETEDEIKGTLALPGYNLRIITAMPFFLVLLVKNISRGYMDPLYETKYGVFVMLGVFAVIASAWFLGSKLCETDV